MQMRLRIPTAWAPSSSDWMPRMIAVAAAEVEHGFDSRLLLNQLARDLGAHARAGPWPVRDVDAVDAVCGAQPRPLDLARVHRAARRQDFDESNEGAGGELAAEPRFLGDRSLWQRRWPSQRLHGGRHRNRLGRLHRTHLGAHHPDMIRRRPAAAAYDPDSGLQETLCVAAPCTRGSKGRCFCPSTRAGWPAFGMALIGFRE